MNDDFLEWLDSWADAYPEEIFPPVDMFAVAKERRDYSHDEVMSIAQRNAAAMARHVLATVARKAREIESCPISTA